MPKALRIWAGPILATAALFLGAELVLRLTGFRYAPVPVTLRYVRAVADKGAASSSRGRETVIPYALDPVLLWKPLPVPGLTNSEGFLGPEWPEAKPKGGVRVVALGDSCTVLGDDPYPGVLEKRLAKDGRKWEVLNAGVASWSSYQGLRLLEARLAGYKADVVTLYFGWNDRWLSWSVPDKDLSGLLERQWKTLGRLESSRLLQAFQAAADRLRGPPKLTPASPHRVALDDYGRNLRAMIELVRRGGGEPVLVTAPTGLTLDLPFTREVAAKTGIKTPELFVELHEAYNAAARSVAEETGTPLADLDAAFSRMKDHKAVFSDGIHLTREGHQRAAALLEPEVRRAAARRQGRP
ncbi:MAG: GDSL-type esterase/lipase family protein [Elusimicrobiota bacterium]|jgi:lysophospholipase L1-like esterase